MLKMFFNYLLKKQINKKWVIFNYNERKIALITWIKNLYLILTENNRFYWLYCADTYHYLYYN